MQICFIYYSKKTFLMISGSSTYTSVSCCRAKTIAQAQNFSRVDLVTFSAWHWLVNKTRATFSTNGNPNQNQSCFGRTRFPALGPSYMYLLRILIGSLCCLHLLRLTRVVTLVSVLRHSIRNRSNLNQISRCIAPVNSHSLDGVNLRREVQLSPLALSSFAL